MATTSNTQFRLKLYPNTSYDFSVDWGDGKGQRFAGTTSSDPDEAGITHEYLIPGIYSVRVTENTKGGFPNIFNGYEEGTLNDGPKITNIAAWGAPLWDSMLSAFDNC